ncbi:MAG: SAM-dependent chlorinase/fluorinase [Candidatus Bathyarchaeota archaeon]|nr:SAM-dependent chlorinase/fluorinase [Candidatus Bathyarchaeota archaeon]
MNTSFGSAYGEVTDGSPLLLIGSSNFLELAINQGNAAKLFEVKVGDIFCVSGLVSD